MRKNGKTNAVGRGGALLRPAGYTELSKIFGESVCTYPLGRRGRCPHRPGRMHRFYGNLRRICNFSMGRQSRRPLQQPFALSVGADDSVCPRDVPILRESSANSQLPPTSKEVTACGFAANSRRNSLHSAGRTESSTPTDSVGNFELYQASREKSRKTEAVFLVGSRGLRGEIEIPPGSFSFCSFFFWRSKRKSWTAAANF